MTPLTPAILEQVFRHALAEFPGECCGMIFRSGRVLACRNAQDDYHAEDPDAFPRTSADGWCFAPEDQFRLARSFDSDDPVTVVYHSHPNGDARFSAADRRGAAVDSGPIYPDLAYLVVACTPDGVTAARLYAFRSGDYRRVCEIPTPPVSH